MFSFLYVEFSRALLNQIRYPANLISGLFINVFMFYCIFMGATFLSGQNSFGSALDSMVVGYTAWVLVNRCFARIPASIESEAGTGVLESVFLSRFNTSLIYTVRGIIDSVIDMVMIFIMIIAIVLMTDSNVSYSWVIALPVITLLFAAIGCGLFAAGLALQFKRVSSVLASVQFLLMFLMFAPFETWTSIGAKAGAVLLPMVPSVVMLRDLMVNNTGFKAEMALTALVNGVLYLALGAVLFHLMIRRACKKGVVGGY